jgi:putative endonuclease
VSLRGHCVSKAEAIFDGTIPQMRYEKYYYVYLLTNFTNRVIYTGVTGDLLARVKQHREKMNEGFTNRYNVWKLVYFEQTQEVYSALEREKQIKAGSRQAKVALVERTNPKWRDLYPELLGGA